MSTFLSRRPAKCLAFLKLLHVRVTKYDVVAELENSALSNQLFAEAFCRYEIAPASLTVHNDSGASMTFKTTKQQPD